MVSPPVGAGVGVVVWVGAGLERVALYFREDAPLLGAPPAPAAPEGSCVSLSSVSTNIPEAAPDTFKPRQPTPPPRAVAAPPTAITRRPPARAHPAPLPRVRPPGPPGPRPPAHARGGACTAGHARGPLQ